MPTRPSPPSKPIQPSSQEQSGSTGRKTPDTDDATRGDTGQDHYGQSGFAGKDPKPNRIKSKTQRSRH